MPPQGRAAPPILPALRSDKIGSSARRLRRSLARTLTRHSPYAASVPSFTNVKETKMTIEQHIEELRAELRNAIDLEERRQIEAELAAAGEELDALLENMVPD
jgi:lipoate-protein ligase A